MSIYIYMYTYIYIHLYELPVFPVTSPTHGQAHRPIARPHPPGSCVQSPGRRATRAMPRPVRIPSGKDEEVANWKPWQFNGDTSGNGDLVWYLWIIYG